QLMAYLYGELSAAEQAAFEEQLQTHPDLQKELKELRSTRSMLQTIEEVQPKNTVVEIRTKPIIPMRAIRWMSLAASLALLLWVGKPRLDFNKTGFTLAFGTMEQAEETVVKSIDYQPLIQKAVAENNRAIYRRLDSIQNSFGMQQDFDKASLTTAIEQELAGYQSRQNRSLMKAVNSEYQQNMPRIVSNVQDMQLEQRREFKRLLNRLWQDVQRQREADLNAIEDAFIELQRQQISSMPMTDEE
ncbi:MAG: hypothetical protein AAF847_20025, partial [Bacteroidota bacterium]